MDVAGIFVQDSHCRFLLICCTLVNCAFSFQVEIYDLSDYDHSEDDVLIMGSDGLWDVTTNSKAAYVVKNCLSQFACDDRSRLVHLTFVGKINNHRTRKPFF